MIQALCVGECMIELRHVDDSTMSVGYAGDTYNTAVYLRRTAAELGVDVAVGYLTGLGSDEFSTDMRAAWTRDGVADRSNTLPGYLPALYTVRVDDQGERRFSYWRSASAARHLFGSTEWVAQIGGVEVIHLSGVTLQLASPSAREQLVDRLATLRSQGALISLDTNYRPSGWEDPSEAARVMDQVSKVATVVLATFEDEVAMHHCQSVPESAMRLADAGVPEVVVKSGAEGAYLLVGGEGRAHTRVPASSASSTPRPPATPSPADIWQRGWGSAASRGAPGSGRRRGHRRGPSRSDHPLVSPARLLAAASRVTPTAATPGTPDGPAVFGDAAAGIHFQAAYRVTLPRSRPPNTHITGQTINVNGDGVMP